MRSVRNLAALVLVLAVAHEGANDAHAVSYQLTDLSPFAPDTIYGFVPSRGTGVNEQGEVSLSWGFNVPSGKGTFPVQAGLYRGSLIDLGNLPGSNNDEAYGVNDSGHVVGRAGASGSGRAFLHDGTSMGELSGLAGYFSEARGVNNSDHVVGWYGAPASPGPAFTHAFRHDGTTLLDLGALGGDLSRGYGINEAGHTTGEAETAAGTSHAFRHDGTTMYDLGTLLGGENSYGRGINVHGHVTGYSQLAPADSNHHAFLFDGTTMHDLGTLFDGPLPAGNSTFGYAVNSHGHVVGEWNSGLANSSLAFLYTPDGGMVDLNTLVDLPSGWTLAAAVGISDAGHITGYARADGTERAFLLTPIPEPGTLLLAVAAASLGWPRFRQRTGHLQRRTRFGIGQKLS